MFSLLNNMWDLSKKIVLILSVFSYGINISAQNHVYKHYGVEDGLPSSEVYSAFQDSKGYMWFATDAGVSRFNGYEFENFDASDGLTDNTVFLITEDHKGRIWFGTFNSKLCYYENDSIYPFRYNDEIKTGIKEKGAIQSFAVDSNDNIWMGFLIEGLYKISSKGVVNQLIEEPKSSDCSLSYYSLGKSSALGNRISKEMYIFTNKLLAQGKSVDRVFAINISADGKTLKDTIVNGYRKGGTSVHLKEYNEGYYLLFDKLFRLKTDSGVLKKEVIKNNIFEGHIHSLLVDVDYLWFCKLNGGVYQCQIKGDSLIRVNHFLENINISRVFKDNRDGYWFMTLSKGLYYLSSKDVEYVKVAEEDEILCLEIDTASGDVFLGFSKGKIAKLEVHKQKSYLKEVANFSKACYSVLFDYSNESLIIGVTNVLNYLPTLNDGKISFMKSFGPAGYKSMLLEDHKFYGAGTFGVISYEDKKGENFSYRDGGERIWSTSVIKYKGEIWLGSNEGIRFYTNNELLNPFSENEYLSSAITSLDKLTPDILLVGTKAFGLLVVENGQVVTRISKETGLLNDLVKTIHVDNQKVVWIGTNSGLNRIDFLSSTSFEISKVTVKKGLISGEISAIRSLDNMIFIATTGGLVQFDKTKIQTNKMPPQVNIKSFTSNSEEREIKEMIQLSYDQNFIKINYEGLNYRSLGEVEYQYRMLGVDTSWTTTNTRFVQYPTLTPNDYQFEVKAKNEDGYWSNPVTVSFTINSPFWFTWWFITLEIALGIGIVSAIFWYREKEIRAKSVVSKKMVELELKALRSQMNPHFIFNTLNSIQHYIAINDFRSTNKYIVQFATLIRTILHLSEKSLITIQEEIDILTMYMDLEKMRFEEQFDYKIEVSKEIDKDYDEIPSMLLQPYVENAIWHGLMSKKGKGLIKIGIREEGEYIYCSVEDNGIGREKAAEIKAKRNIQQKSVGMSVTKERLDLIGNNDFNVETIDLYNDNGEAIGTKMLIRIQYKT